MWELQNEIVGLLKDFRGEEPLKKLFWSALGYDRTEASFPQRLMDENLASQFHEVRLFARYQGLHVIYARMTSQHDGAAAMRALADHVKQVMPYALLVFSDAGQVAWNLVFHRAGRDGEELRHLRIGPDGDSTPKLAAQLARLRTYAKDGRDRPLAGLLNAFDTVFSRGRRQFEPAKQGRDGDTPYWRDVRRYPRLSAKEERDIVVRLTQLRIERTGNKDASREYLDVRNALVCANLLLSAYFAMRLAKRQYAGGLDLDDLIQLGNIGLIRAANCFDAQRGTRFSTYAVRAIKTHLLRAMIVYYGLVRRVDANERPLFKRSVVDVLERHDLRDLNAVGPERGLVLHERRDAVRMAVDRLKPMERVVISARFGLITGNEQTLEETGKSIRLTRESVRQIESKALARLGFLLNADGTPSGRETRNAHARHN